MNEVVNRKFRKLDRSARIAALKDAGVINDKECATWLANEQCVSLETAEHMIENVIGIFGLPEGLAVNFLVNDKHYVIPMVLEEPSVVAGLAFAGLLAEKTGGFKAWTDAPILIGQVQLVGVKDSLRARADLMAQEAEIIAAANALMPKMLERGGGARSIKVRSLIGPNTQAEMLVVNIAIDTRDAMGANLVNSICEGIAPLLEKITAGEAVLKILSNLADEALAYAEVSIAPSQLAVKGFSGESVRDRIVLANDLALVDPYRATTHNKGIMNGIDSVAIATGNDWRSIEAAAHAYAARDGQYRALTQWTCDAEGNLKGRIELPMKVGTVGGSLQTNPAVKLNQNIMKLASASELAGVMAAVGLAQNLAALRALASSGIQQGHMTLHARSVALSANAPAQYFDEVVKRLVAGAEIKVWRAHEIIEELKQEAP